MKSAYVCDESFRWNDQSLFSIAKTNEHVINQKLCKVFVLRCEAKNNNSYSIFHAQAEG